MTKKVVKGSLWTLVGQVVPLSVSLVATPFVIRLLGAEGYGVLILVALIPAYLGFADFGMGMAATKFTSEAFAAGDPEREARTVRTAAVISLCVSIPVAVLIFGFSGPLISLFKVPGHLAWEASLALKFTAITFVVNFLNAIFNTPQLARLRMDLNTLTASGFRSAGIVATPIVIYLGGGILGAVSVLLSAALLTLAGHMFISGRLLPSLFDITIDRSLIRPLLTFGGAVVFVGVAGVILINVEKGLLAVMVSVSALAFYTVASTLANMMVLLSYTMIQSLVPAFSQLSGSESVTQLESLFARIVKVCLLGLIPVAAFLFLGARDLIGLWAGPEFASNSTVPFYVLMAGLLFSVPGYIPYSLLMGTGKASVIAKLYWAELIPYLILVYLCTSNFGIIGTAAAWSLRVAFDGVVFFILARKTAGADLRIFSGKLRWFFVAVAGYLPLSLVVSSSGGSVSIISGLIFLIATAFFIAISWRFILSAEERYEVMSILNPVQMLR